MRARLIVLLACSAALAIPSACGGKSAGPGGDRSSLLADKTSVNWLKLGSKEVQIDMPKNIHSRGAKKGSPKWEWMGSYDDGSSVFLTLEYTGYGIPKSLDKAVKLGLYEELVSKKALDGGAGYTWVSKHDPQKKLVVNLIKPGPDGKGSLRCQATIRGKDATPGAELEARLYALCDSLKKKQDQG